MRKKHILSYLVSLLLCLSFLQSTIFVAAKETVSASNSCKTIDAQVALLGSEELVKNVRSAFIYEMNSDILMYSYNSDKPEEPASLVKIMTALVAIEHCDLDDLVTVKQELLELIPKKTISAKLVADEVISVKDLLYCLLVGSASDAAVVIADYVSGSQEAFVDTMNARAAEIGCTGTVYTNTHGLYSSRQVTTARDTAKILIEALNNETFAEIFCTTYYTVLPTNKSETRELATNNYFMNANDVRIYRDSRVIGGRSGVTEDGTRCMVNMADDDGMRVICVVMGSASESVGNATRVYGGYPETTSLFDICFNQYKTVHVIYDGQILTQAAVSNGANDVGLYVDTSVLTVLPRNITSKQLVFRYNHKNISAPVSAGDHLSAVEIWYNDLCVGQAQLFAVNDVEPAGTLERDVRKSSLSAWWLLLLIPLATVAFLVLKYRLKIRRVFRTALRKIKKHFGLTRSNRRR